MTNLTSLLFMLFGFFCFLAGNVVVVVNADFDDYVDYSFQCPLLTTCPTSCIKDVTDCTTYCPNDTYLCRDGYCRQNCYDDDIANTYINPCDCDDLYACPKNYEPEYYDDCPVPIIEEGSCQKQNKRDLSYNEFGLMLFMALWIATLTILIVSYCHTNHLGRINTNNEEPEVTTTPEQQKVVRIGYAKSSIGSMLYYATFATICCIQLVLLIIVILYYMEQGALTQYEAVTWRNEKRILIAFEIVWVVGFIWMLYIAWPDNLRSIFYRQCGLNEAEMIAVWTPNEKLKTHGGVVQSSRYVTHLRGVVHYIHETLHRIMCFLYSQDPTLQHGKWTYCPVEIETGGSKYFIHNFRRHILIDDTYIPAKWEESNTTTLHDLHNTNPLSDNQVIERRSIVGPNLIEMPKPSFWRIVYAEFTSIYYVYQNFIMWSWVPLFYYYMAIVQTAVIITGGIVVCVFRYRNECSLHRLSHMEGYVTVQRSNGNKQEIEAHELVPGDIVCVRPGPIHCDMVLIREDILVDESALTGESNPIPKSAVDDDADVAYTRQKRHTLQAGTMIVESDDQALAVVTQTGSFTVKGELLREIFSFQRHQFKFDVEVPIVLMILFVYTIIAFAIVVANLRYSIEYAWFYGMYVVAACFPPLLPTAFTVSVGVSDNRLQKHHNVACTKSEEIIIAGKVKRAFFDKTGTLTRQGLEFIQSRSIETWDKEDCTEEADRSPEIAMGMAACHSLVVSINGGELIGNPVDHTMFAASGAHLQHGKTILDSHGNKLDIVKHFDFDHHRMTLSTIVRLGDSGRLIAFVKGSGESVSRLCQPDTLPASFEQDLRASAKAGIYQISMAIKELSSDIDTNQISRDEIEQDLRFIGVINFRNVIRDETPGVIEELENGEIRCIMVTGDSVLTGISIAKEASMILPGRQVLLGDLNSEGDIVWYDEDDEKVSLPEGSLENSNLELAVTGELWSSVQRSDPALASKLADQIRVFGRCTPSDKVSVVTYFVDMGFTTLMCGDGGNDCGALKTAHVGIALSDAEASIVSPFTSLDKSITSVVAVLREGRCALASALANYKFLIMYGQLTVFSHYFESWYHITYSEWCWIFVDGFWVIGLGFTLPLAKPASVLAPTRPTASLLGPITMSSTLGVLLISMIFTSVAMGFLNKQDWYQCRKWGGDDISNVLVIGDNYESETLFIMMAYQLIASAITYNFGYEWRASWWSNRWFVVLIGLFTFLHIFVVLIPGSLSCLFRMNCINDNVLPSVATWEIFPIQNHWNTTVIPAEFRLTLVILIILNTVSVILWDYFVVNGLRRKLGNKARQGNGKFVSTRLPPPESSPV